MDLATILMIVGIVFIALSFFIKDKAKKVEADLEDLSINIYQETNSLKRRLKMVEEELLLEPNFQIKPQKTAQMNQQHAMNTFQQVAAQVSAGQGQTMTQFTQQKLDAKPIHSILVSQVIELDKQGLSIEEISKRSTLTPQQIQSVLATGGRP